MADGVVQPQQNGHAGAGPTGSDTNEHSAACPSSVVGSDSQDGATLQDGDEQRGTGKAHNKHSEHHEIAASTDAQVAKTGKDARNGDKPDTEKKSQDHKPEGGHDSTPVPNAPPGYTIQITIHRAERLPMADVATLSSDPYVLSELTTNLPKRHDEDPPLRNRTFTIHRNLNPEWNAQWVVANVPASGFQLKCQVFDEDTNDHDDRLGNVLVSVPAVDSSWPGFTQQSFRIKKRAGSKRAYLVAALATATRQRHSMSADLILSIELLGRTETSHGGRTYTLGPPSWTKHYGPILGRVTGKKAPVPGELDREETSKQDSTKYNFQAVQLQLLGPVPVELYHRFVEFRSFVKPMFTRAGIRGFFLHKVLKHQHSYIYRYNNKTEFGYLPMEPNNSSSLKFLELVDFDRGGRIFTYVVTLDALWRFTETGHNFGINMLSKHTMHSDVSCYVAFSGEFFVRRLSRSTEPAPEHGGDNVAHPPNRLPGNPDGRPPDDPALYELVIDNDSGTYRPISDLLPLFARFLQRSLPGIKIVTLDCQADGALLHTLKEQQKNAKQQEGEQTEGLQHGTFGSILFDSNDEQSDDPGLVQSVVQDAYQQGKMKKDRWTGMASGREG